MFDWIKDKITEPLQEMILDSINAYFISILGSIVDGLSSVLYHEMNMVKNVFEQPYFTQATHYVQGLAITLLAVRVAYQAFQQYILYSTGQESSPTQILKDAVFATAIIASVPWIVKTVFLFSMSIVDDIMQISAVADITSITSVLTSVLMPGKTITAILILFIIGFVMMLIVLLQIAARAVLVGLLMVVGPFMWAAKQELGAVWFRALLQACLAMPLQMFLLRGAMGIFTNFVTNTNVFFGAILFIGFLWTTIKTPQFLQQWVSSTGIGGAVGGTASTAGQMVMIRRMMAK